VDVSLDTASKTQTKIYRKNRFSALNRVAGVFCLNLVFQRLPGKHN
jgi:hypothetical protein